MSEMTEKQKAARALGYLEGLSVWVWGKAEKDIGCAECEGYDKAIETLRKAIDWGEGE